MRRGWAPGPFTGPVDLAGHLAAVRGLPLTGHVMVTTAPLGRCRCRVRAPSAPPPILPGSTLRDVPEKHHPTPEERDEGVSLYPLDPITALKAALRVDPKSEPVVEDQRPKGKAGAEDSDSG